MGNFKNQNNNNERQNKLSKPPSSASEASDVMMAAVVDSSPEPVAEASDVTMAAVAVFKMFLWKVIEADPFPFYILGFQDLIGLSKQLGSSLDARFRGNVGASGLF